VRVIKIVTVEQMKAIEAAADRAGVTYAMMMEAAGRAVAAAVLERLETPADHKIVILCGSGNNGGDGMVAAHHLAEAGANVSLYFAKMPDEADANLKRVRARGLFVADAENDQRWRVLKNLMGGVTVLIDAVFGTGVRLPLKGKPAEMLKQVAMMLADRDAPPPVRVAVDCPSGMNCDTGALDPAALPADLTVTMICVKRGQLAFPAAEAVSELSVADCGVDEDLPELSAVSLDLGTAASVRALLPRRPRDAHKGTFGRALIVAGSVNYAGAPYLAGAAAYRVGAGLVTLAIPTPIHTALAAQLPEATWLVLPHDMGVIASDAADVVVKELHKTEALLVGPGFGTEKETGMFVCRLLRPRASAHTGAMGFAPRTESELRAETPTALPPLVIDADGLRLLAQIERWPEALPRETVLTPHPGEMAALTGMDKDAIQADRIGTAQKFAAAWGHVVVLKGAFTVVAAPDGRATVQPLATPALARAGTGDVLAGAIAGLLAQGLGPYAAAVAGTYLHGRAGLLAAHALGTTASVLASDVLEALPLAFAEVENE
jgi:NAD(P)H-hydrate epimerase